MRRAALLMAPALHRPTFRTGFSKLSVFAGLATIRTYGDILQYHSLFLCATNFRRAKTLNLTISIAGAICLASTDVHGHDPAGSYRVVVFIGVIRFAAHDLPGVFRSHMAIRRNSRADHDITNPVIRSLASWFYQEAVNSPAWLLEGFRGQTDVIAFGSEQGLLTQIK